MTAETPTSVAMPCFPFLPLSEHAAAEYDRWYKEYYLATKPEPTPHQFAVQGMPVGDVSNYLPWVGWLYDPQLSAEQGAIQAVVREACLLLEYDFCWIRDGVKSTFVTQFGLEVSLPPHIPVFFGRKGTAVVEGMVYCVLHPETRLPVRMMKLEERGGGPDGPYPVELWMFDERAARYRPVNVSRFFKVPGKVLRERRRMEELKKRKREEEEEEEW